MPGFRYLLTEAARKLASDPRLRAKATEVFEQEIKPRAQAAWEEAKPRAKAALEDAKPRAKAAWDEAKPRAKAAWDGAKPKLRAAKDELREVARDSPAADRAREFAAKLKARWDDRRKDG